MIYHGFHSFPNLVSITPRIFVSSQTWATPFGVTLDCWDTTFSFSDSGTAFDALRPPGTPRTAMDLHIEVDFGDGTAPISWTDWYTGQTIEVGKSTTDAGGQAGPCLAYVYRSPGTYTITVTFKARRPDGSIYSISSSDLIVQEYHTLEIRNSTSSGAFTLVANGMETASLPWNARADQVETALNAVLGANAIEARGGPFNSLTYPIKLWTRALAPTAVNFTVGANTTGGTITATRARTSSTHTSVLAEDLPSGWTEMCWDSVGGNDANPGTFASPKQTFGNFETWINGSAGGKRKARLKRGSSWVRNTSVAIGASGGNDRVVCDYGSGALPVIYSDSWGGSTSQGFFNITAGYGASVERFAFQGLRCVGSTNQYSAIWLYGGGNGTASELYGKLNQITVVGCEFDSYRQAPIKYDNYQWGLVILGNTFTHTSVAYFGENHTFGNCSRFHALVANSYSGGGDDDIYQHSAYPGVGSAFCAQINHFGLNRMQSFSINTDIKPYSGGGTNAWNIVISGNYFSGSPYGVDMSHNQGITSEGLYYGSLVQRNRFTAQRPNQDPGAQNGLLGDCIYGTAWKYGTIRDNMAYGNIGAFLGVGAIQTTGAILLVYRNRYYANPTDPCNQGGKFAEMASGGVSWPGALVTDNACWATRVLAVSSSPGLLSHGLTPTYSNYVVDRNKWYAPLQGTPGDKPFTTNNTWARRDFAAHKTLTGWDANSTYAQPAWTDPQNGVFGDNLMPAGSGETGAATVTVAGTWSITFA
jgi:hypothetical protein